MDIKIGFVGTGNMGSALIKSLVKSNFIPVDRISMFDVDKYKLEQLKSETGVGYMASAKEVVLWSDVIILAVKPNILKNVLEDLMPEIDNKKVIVSFAVGIPISFYEDILGTDKKIVRTMPNTPAMVGEGMTLICENRNVTELELTIVKKLFDCAGKCEVLPEKLMTEVTALTGSSPAYVFMFIEAMADAAVLSGIPRDMSYRLAAQAVLGSAKMVLETGLHPGVLKDQVCSPGGTTIEAVSSLEKNGFRYTIMEAMDECTKKARLIGEAYNK
ncbi:MAG: pyrroline-5-carboxylate reductase [Eubacterium sp.]|nr:pyrroline-5-carboxylate reductase [Eubacterium sp.]